MSRPKAVVLKTREPLRLGFMPVADCAPLVYAQEAGVFTKYGLDVELHRETSWANIRDKIINGDLDAAHAPAMLPFLANLGLDSDPCSCVSGMVLSLQGNAITISRTLWEQGVRDAVSLRERVYGDWGRKTFTFGVPFNYSSQNYLLQKWLKSGGVNPATQVRILVVPPEQLYPTLKLGYIDGFCSSEPWNSLATQAGEGVCVSTSAQLVPLHPEKVLMARQSFATGRADEHERIIAALLEACAFCEQQENREMLTEMLSHPQYVNAPRESLGAGFSGPFEMGEERIEGWFDLTLFNRHMANDPSDDKAEWIINSLYELLEQKALNERRTFERAPIVKNIFRRDVFERGRAALISNGEETQPEARTRVASSNGVRQPSSKL